MTLHPRLKWIYTNMKDAYTQKFIIDYEYIIIILWIILCKCAAVFSSRRVQVGSSSDISGLLFSGSFLTNKNIIILSYTLFQAEWITLYYYE